MIGKVKMNEEKRSIYLSEVWSKRPYPMASPGWVHGRLSDLNSENMHIFGGVGLQSFDLSLPLELAPGFLIQECLVPGDIIEIQTKDQKVSRIHLLVPSLGPNIFEKAPFDLNLAQEWTKFMASLRGYFIEKNFVELKNFRPLFLRQGWSPI